MLPEVSTRTTAPVLVSGMLTVGCASATKIAARLRAFSTRAACRAVLCQDQMAQSTGTKASGRTMGCSKITSPPTPFSPHSRKALKEARGASKWWHGADHIGGIRETDHIRPEWRATSTGPPHQELRRRRRGVLLERQGSTAPCQRRAV